MPSTLTPLNWTIKRGDAQKIARALNLSKSHISRVLKGERSPTREARERIAQILAGRAQAHQADTANGAR